MAQKREKEETELKVPESLPLCSSTLSLTAPPPTQHLSAADISDLKLTGLDESRSNSGTSPEIVDPKFSSSESRSSSVTTLESIYPKLLGIDELRSSSAASSESMYLKLLGIDELRSSSATTPESTDRKAAVKRPREASRCSGIGCRRKVGLMPFRCRCGEVFCSEHRYSDRHDCSYDYKAAGREAIARENPVVKAAKILKV